MGPLVQNVGEGDQMGMRKHGCNCFVGSMGSASDAQRSSEDDDPSWLLFGGPQASEHELLEAKGAFVGEVPPRGFHLLP